MLNDRSHGKPLFYGSYGTGMGILRSIVKCRRIPRWCGEKVRLKSVKGKGKCD